MGCHDGCESMDLQCHKDCNIKHAGLLPRQVDALDTTDRFAHGRVKPVSECHENCRAGPGELECHSDCRMLDHPRSKVPQNHQSTCVWGYSCQLSAKRIPHPYPPKASEPPKPYLSPSAPPGLQPEPPKKDPAPTPPGYEPEPPKHYPAPAAPAPLVPPMPPAQQPPGLVPSLPAPVPNVNPGQALPVPPATHRCTAYLSSSLWKWYHTSDCPQVWEYKTPAILDDCEKQALGYEGGLQVGGPDMACEERGDCGSQNAPQVLLRCS